MGRSKDYVFHPCLRIHPSCRLTTFKRARPTASYIQDSYKYSQVFSTYYRYMTATRAGHLNVYCTICYFFVYCKPAFVVDVLSWFMIFPFKTSKLPPKVRGGQARMAFKGPKTMPEARCREAVAPHWSSLVYKPHEYYG